MNDSAILEVKDLHVHFELEQVTVRAVEGVSFSLNRKRTLGIVGESGCGKSITAMAIMRLIQSPPGKITGGSINLRRRDGDVVDIAQLSAKGPAMRSIRGAEIAMIFQEPMTSLNPIYNIGDQIAESVMLHQRLSKKDALGVALDMLHKVHLSAPETRIKQYPHQLSGGMRQRVMIALAMSCNPSILIADEPTTALDVTVQAQILDLMAQLQESFDSSIIMITHNLGVISDIADDTAVMYLGKIVEQAPTHELFENPLHPYTRGLLNSVPVLGQKKQKKLIPIPGMVPSPTEELTECAFKPRCDRKGPDCDKGLPPLREVSPGHFAACYYEH
ncbi:ABC transporter ATP-binding protein [Leadbettera azotonutricia]|uniref:Oligopeptide transport ATP-binding protein AppD n=1 Tax=Leadbettera azotonutricia (strain ATCC BAA-888 / DSM 13862 / ZAS-9) TaxID=545695 RepID=F5Y7F0_LEAAZ|nr:ABC transporter ATP-binding protein [Leadbettera azotonutricia]AEF83007.1 oligopeptide transport ATP-binding protein AppD [Leadbettera azotonutricia ZAS-9]